MRHKKLVNQILVVALAGNLLLDVYPRTNKKVEGASIPTVKLEAGIGKEVPLSGPEPELTDIWVRDSRSFEEPTTYLHKTAVLPKITTFRTQKIDKDKEIILPPVRMAWNGNYNSSVEQTLNTLSAKYDEYTIKSAIVYPVHRRYTYPVSEMDAFVSMWKDNQNNRTSVLNELAGATYLDVLPGHMPYYWKIAGSSYPKQADPWMSFAGPKGAEWGDKDFFYVWAAEKLRPLVDRQEYFGRAHPVFYTPGNDPYMKEMKYSDWTYYGAYPGKPDGTSKSYWYYYWKAMVHLHEFDYRVQVKMEKKVPDAKPVPEEPVPEPEPNKPPIASIWTQDEYFWVEDVIVQDNSYDTDGTIVSNEFQFDGQFSQGNTKKYSRVTQPETHSVSVKVTDDDGDSDQTERQFKILPTTPKADFGIGGVKKVNRAVFVDATASEVVTPSIRVAPLDYTKTSWTIKPLTPGVTLSDVMIRQAADKRKLEFLSRKAGEFEVTLTVTNSLGETSDPVTKKFTVVEDEKPLAKFMVNSKIELRDKASKQATIRLTDLSESFDNDPIQQRIWSVEFDSNNDGFIGTAQDAPKVVIDSGNKKYLEYKTDKVGNYRFSLEVKESFGQPTLPEFIQDSHYMRDASDTIQMIGGVTHYLQNTNFNIPEKDKIVQVNNAPPIVDFGMVRHNKVDIILNFGGLDQVTQKHKTGPVGSGAAYTPSVPGTYYDWATYDHYYNEYETSSKTKMMSYAANLETDLKTKGIDAKVSFDNSYYKVLDPDGTGIRGVQYWDWYYWTEYVDGGTITSYDPNYRPPAGYEIYNVNTSKEYNHIHASPGSYRPTNGWVLVREWWEEYNATDYTTKLSSYNPPIATQASHPGPYGYTSAKDGTKGWFIYLNWHTNHVELERTTYYYSIRKPIYKQRMELKSTYNEGLTKEQVNATDFTSSFVNQSYRPGADKYYVRMDKNPWNWMGDSSKVNSMANKIKNENISFWSLSDVTNKSNAESLFLKGLGNGKYQPYDPLYLSKNVSDIQDYYINKYVIKENPTNLTIVLGDKLNYNVTYNDFEGDPEIKREWNFNHDPSSVNGRKIDDAPFTPISEHNSWINAPAELSKVGTYKIQLRAQDDPVHWKDARFNNFRKWSDESLVREYTVNVHRRPVADFTFSVDGSNNYALTLDPTASYDPDYKKNRSDKGIVAYNWISYVVDGVKYNGKPPANLQKDKVYDVTLEVEDIDGAFGSVTKRIDTGFNVKPIAKFDVQDEVYRSEPLNFTDLSYDPNGDPLKDYEITIRKQGESTILSTLQTWPNSFSSLGLAEGSYVIGLTVWDEPKQPPSLQSDLFEKQVKVVKDNQPPKSVFTLSPSPIELGKVAVYKDSSYDPDNHIPLKYAWKVEKLNGSGGVEKEWQVGYVPTDFRDFGGIGKYRVYQTVWDSPPAPLPSLSDTSMVEIEVIKGPDHPFAEFTWTPQPAVEGKNITFDPSPSYDLDGTIVGYEWSIKSPTGTAITSTSKNPVIANALVGTYKVSLQVIDNDGLKSLVPALHDIVVTPKPPNNPPTALFDWSPVEPFIGKTVTFNPDTSFDVDGAIVQWNWKFKDKNGVTTTSNQRYPSIIAVSDYYDVELTVTDNSGGKGISNRRMNVNIAALEALVTHTPEWKEKWVKNGMSRDTNHFRAGEKFVIELTTTPANRVMGNVNFGGEIGNIDIPSSAFTLVSSEPYKMVWRAELWRDDFIYIPEGEYLFRFTSFHPVNSPYVQAEDTYLVKIVGNIYDEFNFHRNY
ncbi:PKD domain-containing protein [Fictibacillus sp. 7GRE50]|uniref:PKD domain-containing protein n=1 Tax=Fictibacillus sp. 7GRE50 TaxID=2745878 RepID=UPI0018CD957C|nr:PKD domain-containing protein [Fictibacillus sp. 7GRE50]MBH0167146.1 PKD domain-containing protein [Fictibacillus sp. 7GRE50]